MASPGAVLIDVRAADMFVKLRVGGSLSFPAAELKDRMFELPPRTVPLVVLYDKDCVKGEVDTCVELIQRAKWALLGVVLVDDIKGLNACTSVSHTLVEGPLLAAERKARGWSPSPFAEQCFQIVQKDSKCPRLLYDIGCGAGRDMAYAAAEGWHVVGIDNRPRLLIQARALQERGGLGAVDPLVAHLGTSLPLREGTAGCVLMVRFLHRPVLESMLLACAVGGYFVCSHFVDGCQHSAVGTPKSEDAFLKHWELRTIVDLLKEGGRATFDIIVDDEQTIDDGRPVSNFFAKRIA